MSTENRTGVTDLSSRPTHRMAKSAARRSAAASDSEVHMNSWRHHNRTVISFRRIAPRKMKWPIAGLAVALVLQVAGLASASAAVIPAACNIAEPSTTLKECEAADKSV